MRRVPGGAGGRAAGAAGGAGAGAGRGGVGGEDTGGEGAGRGGVGGEDTGGGDRAARPAWLIALLAAFLVAIAAILGASLIRPEVPVFAAVAAEPREAPTGLAGPDTVTLDARAGEGWVGIDLATLAVGDVRSMPAAWDIAAQRHRLIANGGDGFLGRAGVVAVARPWPDVREAPEAGYAGSVVSPGGDSIHGALDDWYAYHFLSHLLEPAERTYVVRTTAGAYAKVRVLGYYCPGVEPGCVTLEVAYQGDGSRELDGG